MDSPKSSSQRPALLPARNDNMKHFARERPWVKLCALLIDKLPSILMAAGGFGGLVFWIRHFS